MTERSKMTLSRSTIFKRQKIPDVNTDEAKSQSLMRVKEWNGTPSSSVFQELDALLTGI